MNAVQEENSPLNDLVISGNPIPTHAKKYVGCFTSSTERLHALNTILKCETGKLKTGMGPRKRRVINDAFFEVVTVVEILNSIKEVERITREKKVIQSRAQRKRGSRKESRVKSKEELKVTEDEEIEMPDCIEAEM